MVSFAYFASSSSTAPVDPSITSAGPLLILTLVFGLLSFICSIYTITRILLPLLPSHVLHRRRSPYSARSPRKSLHQIKAAHRFNVHLTIVDLASVCILIGEAAVSATSTPGGLGGSAGAVVRIWICVSARPTFLFVVSFLSYINVVKGKTIHLGRFDWILWFPATVVIVFGAVLSTVNWYNCERSSWIGLLVLSIVLPLSTTLAFAKLLYAISKVVKGIKSHRPYSIWGQSINTIRQSYLPPLYLNSNISDTFVRQAQYSTSTVDLSSDSDPASTRAVPAGRSPYGIFDGPRSVDPQSDSGSVRYSQSHLADIPFSFESLPRPSFSSTVASENTGEGGIVGSSSLRIAIQQEDWSRKAAYGRSSTATLSEREVRAAVVRTGGHLASSLFTWILAAPFLFSRALGRPSTLAADVAFVMSVCTSSMALATQVAIADGFWFRVHFEAPSTLASAAASGSTLEIHIPPAMADRSARGSMTPSMRNEQIRRMDFDERKTGRLSRAFAMVAPHPKLLLLPTHLASSSSTQYAAGAQRNSQHLRLRSLPMTAGKKSVDFAREFDDYSGRRKMDSRASFGGFSSRSIAPPYSSREEDQLITRSLLAASRQSNHSRRSGASFASGSKSRQLISPSPTPTWSTFDLQTATPSPNQPRNSSPLLSPDFLPAPTHDNPLPDYSIDRLSSQLIPRLVPSVRLSRRISILSSLPSLAPEDRPEFLTRSPQFAAEAVELGSAGRQVGAALPEISEGRSDESREPTEVIGRSAQDFEELERIELALQRVDKSSRFERDEAEEEAGSSDGDSEEELEGERKDETMEILANEEMEGAHEESFTEELAREGEEQMEDEQLIGAYERRTAILPSDTSSIYGTTIDLSHLTVPVDSSGSVEEEQELEEFDSKAFSNESVEGMLARLDNFIQRTEARNSNGSTITTSSTQSSEEDDGVITFASIESVHHLSQLSPRSFASSFALKRGDSTGGFSFHDRTGSFGSISENMSSPVISLDEQLNPQTDSISSARQSISEVETLRNSTLLSPGPTKSHLVSSSPANFALPSASRSLPARRRLFVEPKIDVHKGSPDQFQDGDDGDGDDARSMSSSGTPTPKARGRVEDSRTRIPPLPDLLLPSHLKNHPGNSGSAQSQDPTDENRESKIATGQPFSSFPLTTVLPLSPRSRRRFAVKNTQPEKSNESSRDGKRIGREETENVEYSTEVSFAKVERKGGVQERSLKMLR